MRTTRSRSSVSLFLLWRSLPKTRATEEAPLHSSREPPVSYLLTGSAVCFSHVVFLKGQCSLTR
jgi:hypothetical protein